MMNKLLLVVSILSSSAVFTVVDAQQASARVRVNTQSGYGTKAVLAGPDDDVSELVKKIKRRR